MIKPHLLYCLEYLVQKYFRLGPKPNKIIFL